MTDLLLAVGQPESRVLMMAAVGAGIGVAIGLIAWLVRRRG